MKQLLTRIALLFCLVSQTVQSAAQEAEKKAREESLSLSLSAKSVPLEERDQQGLDYAKKFSADLPPWLPYLAAMENLSRTFSYLLEQGIYPKTQFDAGWIVFSQPLDYLMQWGNVNAIRTLGDTQRELPQDLVASLIKNMQDPDFVDPGKPSAAIAGQTAILTLLLDKGINPAPADNGLLLATLAHGNYDAARELIKRGAPTNKIIVTKEQGTRFPLLIAIENSWKNPARAPEMITRLIGKGANVNAIGGIIGKRETTPLEAAIGQGHEAIARLLVQHGANLKRLITIPTSVGRSTERELLLQHIPVLHAAAYSLMPELMRDLIAKKISVKELSQLGATALHMACLEKMPAGDPTNNLTDQEKIARLKTIFELLLNNKTEKISVDTQDRYGNTPLHYLLTWPEPHAAITVLLGFNPKVTIKNKQGQTAIDVARELQKRELDFNTKNRIGEAIMAAKGTRDWPADAEIQAVYKKEWDDSIAQMGKLS